MNLPLFEKYPSLQERLPRVSLGIFPTPVEALGDLSARLDIGRLYVKRDDVSGAVYGGNKVRKLEFLIGAAIASGAREVMTFGCAGSNHATATAVYAYLRGMRSVNMLLPQPNASSVRRNLLLSLRFDAELHHYENSARANCGTRWWKLIHRLRTGCAPYVIPPGGSSPLGAVGFVNAAFELRDQIACGQLQEPDWVYVPGGTVGTAAGLMAGLRAAELKTRVVIVRVTSEKFVGMGRVLNLYRDTCSFIHRHAEAFPSIELRPEEVQLRHDFYGGEYARYTRESVDAVKRLREFGVHLEGTYTGKTAAALIHDAQQGKLKEATVLLWNTYNSRDFTNLIRDIDYRALPGPFHRYFEEDVQPLDKELQSGG